MADTPPPANAEQIDYWNAKAGETWARFQEQLDRQIAPLGAAGIRALAPQPGERILDIGCGCGATTLALAAEVAPGGSVLGLDISQPMLDVARRRAAGVANVAFREADAQTDDFGRGGFDAIFSRFGVMFFADPQAAFANIATKLAPGGRLTFVCWRPLVENDWMRVPLAAALPLLPPLPPPDPLAPGPFAFADPDRVRALLTGAGWHSVNVEPWDADIGSGDLDATVDLTFRVGPLGMALREFPDRLPA
ncbi:MAG: class I SAM-dependent methyltransferase, partial [Polymorphobacter sp.]